MCWKKCFSALNQCKGGGRGETKEKLWVRGEGDDGDSDRDNNDDGDDGDGRNSRRRRKNQSRIKSNFLKRIEKKRKWEKSEGKIERVIKKRNRGKGIKWDE